MDQFESGFGASLPIMKKGMTETFPQLDTLVQQDLYLVPVSPLTAREDGPATFHLKSPDRWSIYTARNRF